MPLLPRTPRNLHKLIKLKHPPLTATPPFAPLVENRLARVMHALLPVPRRARHVLCATSPPLARRVRGDFDGRVVGFVFGRCRRGLLWRGGRVCACGGEGVCCGRDGDGFGGFNGREVGDVAGLGFWFGGGSVVDGGVFARGAGGDVEEFFEGEDAGFAAFPAWYACSR